MKSRSRWLTALIALLALFASSAQQARASMCALPAEAAHSSASVPGSMAGHGLPDGSHGAEQDQPAHRGPIPCPLQAGSPTCTVVTLPASAERGWDLPLPAGENALAFTDRISDLLIGSSHFRPPQV